VRVERLSANTLINALAFSPSRAGSSLLYSQQELYNCCVMMRYTMDIGWQELVIILVIVIAVFGANRLSGIGGALGNSIREFRQAFRDEAAPSGGERPAGTGPADGTSDPQTPRT
jgi:sec-independent protein translocase protein TatA